MEGGGGGGGVEGHVMYAPLQLPLHAAAQSNLNSSKPREFLTDPLNYLVSCSFQVE